MRMIWPMILGMRKPYDLLKKQWVKLRLQRGWCHLRRRCLEGNVKSESSERSEAPERRTPTEKIHANNVNKCDMYIILYRYHTFFSFASSIPKSPFPHAKDSRMVRGASAPRYKRKSNRAPLKSSSLLSNCDVTSDQFDRPR